MSLYGSILFGSHTDTNEVRIVKFDSPNPRSPLRAEEVVALGAVRFGSVGVYATSRWGLLGMTIRPALWLSNIHLTDQHDGAPTRTTRASLAPYKLVYLAM